MLLSLMRFLRAGVVSCLFVFASVARAAEALPCTAALPASPLALSDALDFALCNQPQTRVAWAQVRAQEAARAQAAGALLPSATLAADWQRDQTRAAGLERENNALGASLRLAYTLFDFGQREARLASADATLAAAGHARDTTFAQVWLNTAQRYFNVARTVSQIEAARAAEKAAQVSLAAAENRARVGSATQLDVLQARASLAQATLNRIKAEGQLDLSRGLLAQAMGISPQVLPPIRNIPADLPLLPIPESELGQLLDEAMRERPEVRQALASIDAAEASIRAARASGLPSLSLGAGLNASRSDNLNQYGNSIGLTLSVPLDINGITRAQVQQAQAQRDAQAASLDVTKRSVESDAWQSFYNLRLALETVGSAQAVEANTGRAADAALARYEAGISSILDVLSAQTAHANAQQQLTAARFDWLTARASLAWALGGSLSASPLAWRPILSGDQSSPPATSTR